MNDLVPLHALPRGRSARIERLAGHAEQRRRLEELGLRCGATVQMVRGGTPCIVRFAAGKVCFRQSAALDVLVRPAKAR